MSVSIEDGTLSEDQLRDLLTSFGHLQSFYPSSGVRLFPAIHPLVPDRLIALHLSVTSQSIPTLDVPRRSSTAPMTCAWLVLVSAPNLPLRKTSLRTPPQRVPLRNPAESAHVA